MTWTDDWPALFQLFAAPETTYQAWLDEIEGLRRASLPDPSR